MMIIVRKAAFKFILFSFLLPFGLVTSVGSVGFEAKMYDHQEICQFLINILTKFGLGLDGGRRLKATCIMLVTIPFLTIFLMLSTDYASTVEDKIRVFQVVPLFILIPIKALNIKIKFRSILSLFEATNGMLQDIGQQKIINQSQNNAIKIIKGISLLNMFSIALSSLSAILTHELMIPVWIQVVEYETVFFWLNWFVFYFCTFYVHVLTYLMDALVLYLLMTLKGYSQMLRESILEIPKDEKKRKDKIYQFMRQVHELKS